MLHWKYVFTIENTRRGARIKQAAPEWFHRRKKRFLTGIDCNSQYIQKIKQGNSCKVGPQKYFLPSKYREQGPDFYNFEVRKDDVWIVTFPRSGIFLNSPWPYKTILKFITAGTTIMQEMLWLFTNNLDYKAALATSLAVRVPFVE
jgi:hypothetical protein